MPDYMLRFSIFAYNVLYACYVCPRDVVCAYNSRRSSFLARNFSLLLLLLRLAWFAREQLSISRTLLYIFHLKRAKIDVSLSAYISHKLFLRKMNIMQWKMNICNRNAFIVVSWRQRLTRAQHFVSDFAVRQGYVWEALDVTRRRTHCDQVLCCQIHTYTDSSVANDLYKM